MSQLSVPHEPSSPGQTLTWFNNMTQINAGPAQVRRWTPWIIRREWNTRGRIHFLLNCRKDKAADKDLNCCIPGINIIWSADTEVLWRVEIIMIICSDGVTWDYCGPEIPIALPISQHHTEMFTWIINLKFSLQKIEIGKAGFCKLLFCNIRHQSRSACGQAGQVMARRVGQCFIFHHNS